MLLTVNFYQNLKMNVKEAIEKRRSIRKYKSKEISEELLNEILEAARLAPSGNNAQPWKFKVIRDEETKDKLKQNGIFKQDFVYSSPVIIVCCADPDAYPQGKFEPGFDDSNEFRASRDLSLACQNLVLRATDLGLGTCYVGWMNKDKIKEVLDLPKTYIIPYIITIGYADEKPSVSSRKAKKDIILK